MPERTPSQTVGPFFYFGLCERPAADLAAADDPGAVRIEGRVLDGAREPVSDAMVEIWQADESGRYREDWGWARCGTDAEGRYGFTTRMPGRVPGHDGALQAPHLELLVFARGVLKHLLTRVYFADEPANAEDPLLSSLEPEEHATLLAEPRDGAYVFDLRLQGDRQTVFLAV